MPVLIDKIWYGKHPLQWLLWPCSWVYQIIVRCRRWFLKTYCQISYPVPILVVGNLTVGGVGKTPLVIALAKHFQELGISVGIVSRGYKACIQDFPYQVGIQDHANQVGDEPLLLAQKTQCPVVIDPKRTRAVAYLLKHHQTQIILSDDGLQHYKMGRAIEVLVVDGMRGLGNGLCLPAGPLREPIARMKQVDFVVVNEGDFGNAFKMHLKPGKLINLGTKQEVDEKSFAQKAAAVAAIGNPERFYNTLNQLGIKFNAYSYPDHYQFSANDLNYQEPLIIMTEKDAVKCRTFTNANKLYCLPVEAIISEGFWDALWSHQKLQGLKKCLPKK